MARWKWHLGGEHDRVDQVGPATMYGGQRGAPNCQPRPGWASEPTGEHPAGGGLVAGQAGGGDTACQQAETGQP
jgi:hypothetical protein